MPLIKGRSKKSFDHNVKAEMDAGKPQDQALAIAYSVKKKAPKKMYKGGMLPKGSQEDSSVAPAPRKPDDRRPPMDEYMADHFSEGGEVEEHYESIADAILAKKRQQADLNKNSEEQPNQYYKYNEEAGGEEQYDLDQLSPQPMDSNEHGDPDLEEDKRDFIDEVRRKVMAKRR